MKKYRAVLFDLFGTVALFQPDKLPLFEWQGKSSRSTMGSLRAVIEQKVPHVPFESFFATLAEVSRELGDVRTREMREFSSAHRFGLTLVRAGLPDSSHTLALAEELALAHMALLAAATEIPSAHVTLLNRTREQYGVALVSNFDHGPTARGILLTGGIEEQFQHIAISAEHGWRKPHPQIFADALAALGVEARAALFVGDSPADDIVGAKGVGMDIAWVNASAIDLPAGIPAPDYIVRALPELQDILFNR
ncbi:MAG TPA: HAD family hydrolase [Candidatus Binatia bacterium]|nr:HAD family hydrolase [Candidatus Binatia bacterium]